MTKIGWPALVMSLSGVAVQAFLPEHIKYSFVIFIGANCLWFVNGWVTKNKPLMTIQLITGAMNVVAIIHRF